MQSNSSSWNLQETGEILRLALQPEKAANAARSFQSIAERLAYAELHLEIVRDRWTALLEPMDRIDSILTHLLGAGSAEEKANRSKQRFVLGANILACVQSMHALSDIIAFSLFLGFNLPLPANKTHRHVNAKMVRGILSSSLTLSPLADFLKRLTELGSSSHLSALANAAKHRAIVRDGMYADLTGVDDQPVRLQFEAFKYERSYFPKTDVVPLLQSEYDRVANEIVGAGATINTLLRTHYSV